MHSALGHKCSRVCVCVCVAEEEGTEPSPPKKFKLTLKSAAVKRECHNFFEFKPMSTVCLLLDYQA